MSLAWTPEMKEIAKAEKKVLVKLQCQYKFARGGDFKIVGPFPEERSDALLRIATLPRERWIELISDVLSEFENVCSLDEAEDRERVASALLDRLLGGGR